MPLNLTQCNKKKGFTLIELLVVVVLLGVVTSFAVLSMGSSGIEREMQEEAKRLHALIKLVREEAIIQAKEIAMEINKQEYLFLEYKDKKWIPLTSKIFHARSIKDALEFRVETETKLLYKTSFYSRKEKRAVSNGALFSRISGSAPVSCDGIFPSTN